MWSGAIGARRSRNLLATVVGTALIAGVVLAAPANALSASGQPRPTPAPSAPGISIAVSHQLDLPDPFLLAARGKYYLYLSTAFADATESNIPVLVGRPGHWGPASDALPSLPPWGLPAATGARVWSPNVVHLGNRYVMYYAAQLAGNSLAEHCIGVATARSPAGPFTPVPGPPIVCQLALGGDIDAQVFTDPGGPRGPRHPAYLVWKSDQNDLPGLNLTSIWAAPLSNDGLRLEGAGVQIFSAHLPWQEPVLEAPQMVRAPDGTAWLFYSAGTGFYSPRYAMGVARCAGPLGGCHDVASGPFLASNAQGAGPGEETVFVAADHSTWILYSPWHTGDVSRPARPVEAVRIGWRSRGPYVAEAGRFPSP